ncbi:MAG: glycoside hydrolase family 10 protein, partial [Pyrinomonadaceae bacterium]
MMTTPHTAPPPAGASPRGSVSPSKPRARAARALLAGAVFCSLLLAGFGPTARAQNARTEYRAFWVDTFNTTLNNHNDVLAIVNNTKAAKANAIFIQVRRRGDAWYLNSLEPPPDFTPIAAGFDPLQDLINEAHANGIEVHAFVIVGAVWNKNPTFAPTATLGPPTNPDHVFNRHGGYDPATRRIVTGPNNWLTRTLLPDGAAGISFQGHRFGSDFWIDLGHPDAAADTVDVLTHLVRNYDIDGLHLDRIRYPEIGIAGQTPSTGANIGYNETSVARFQRRHGIAAGSPPPAPGDALWAQWRRAQVTNLVRRVYLNAVAVRPRIKISAALIAFGGGPVTEAQWNSAEAYWRVYQDWRAWTAEGILDIAMPMNYKRENVSAQAVQYDQWNEWTKNHQYNRAGMIGQGAFLNSVEGTLRQTRRALAPSAAGGSGLGVIYFSMATSNVAVAANPHSVPPGQN